jgi:hypothetical protein
MFRRIGVASQFLLPEYAEESRDVGHDFFWKDVAHPKTAAGKNVETSLWTPDLRESS